MAITATYVSPSGFTVLTDRTSEFITDRRVKANCGVDGYKFGTITSSSLSGANTLVNLTEASDDLTSNLTEVYYGIVSEGASGSVPVHNHNGNEGSGGGISQLVASDGDPNPALSVDAAGYVGIGATPTRRLLVSESGASVARFENTAGVSNAVELKNAGSSSPHPSLKSSSQKLILADHSGDTVTLSGGNVGIGTTSPQNTLNLHKSDSSYTNIQFTNATTGNSTASDGFRVGLGSTEDGYVMLGEANDLHLGTNNTTQVTITSAGNVGIGEVPSTVKLYVKDTDSYVVIEGTTDDAYLVLNSGTDGVEGEVSGVLFQDNSVNKWLLAKTGNNDFYLYDYTRDDFVFYVKDNGDMYLMQAGGDVGIGTDSPANKLHILENTSNGVIKELLTLDTDTQNIGVSGSGQVIGFRGSSDVYSGGVGGYGSGSAGGIGIWSSAISGFPDLYVRGGNVGIGKINPTEKLEVSPDEDKSAIIGRAKIGYVGWSDWAGFGHTDSLSTTGYAILQGTTGQTNINAAPGQNLRLTNANSLVCLVDADGMDFSVGKILNISEIRGLGGGLDIADSSGNVGIHVGSIGAVNLKNGTDINEFSTDVSLSGNSDDAVPTEKAVKNYVDTEKPNDNILINQDFSIWQENITFTDPANDDYMADGYRLYKTGTTPPTVNVKKNTTDMELGYGQCCELEITDVGTGPFSWRIHQRVEDFTKYRGKTVTATLRIRSSTAITFGVNTRFWMYDGISSYVTTISSLDTTWDTYTVTKDIASGASALWVMFGINTSISTSGSIYLQYMKLEVGSVATPLIPRRTGDELRLCQRYYQKSYLQSVFPGASTTTGQEVTRFTGVNSSAHDFYRSTRLPVIMKAAPTVTVYPNSNSSGYVNMESGIKSATVDQISESGFRVHAYDSTASVNRSIRYHYVAVSRV